MDKKAIEELLDKYIKGTCTPEEKLLFESLYSDVLNKQTDDPQHIDYASTGAAIFEKLPKPPSRSIVKILRYVAAASILACISAAGVLFFLKKPAGKRFVLAKEQTITPGGNIATLTLSNGQQIALNDSAQGELATQSGIHIVKTKHGQLIYSAIAGNAANEPVGFNIAATPKGGQYSVQLADGTLVWLNAASSLKFPVRFAGKERVVELQGEAYFEVAAEAGKPFIVETANEKVLVLGTHFNINAYSDEPVAVTTLLEGSVKVQSTQTGKASILKPGEQSLADNNQLTIQAANLEEAVAWKNGYFRFNDERIADIMKKLERWYNIEVIYEGKPSEELFNGKISRFKDITQVLRMLEKTEGIHFKIQGRRVTVMP